MPHDENCIFCKIIGGKIPCFKLFEDEQTLAFMDINPANEGHSLVIAKGHYSDLFSITSDALAAVARTIQKIAPAIRDEVQAEGVNLLQANGKAAAQSVFHFHMHILPRRIDDGLHLNWIPKQGDMKKIGELAARIRARIPA